MNTPEDDRAKSARYLETRGREPVCRETGAEAISGTCPVHKGDRCLVARPVSVEGPWAGRTDEWAEFTRCRDRGTHSERTATGFCVECSLSRADFPEGDPPPVSVEGEDERFAKAYREGPERAMLEGRVNVSVWRDFWNAALAASPSSPTGPRESNAERQERILRDAPDPTAPLEGS